MSAFWNWCSGAHFDEGQKEEKISYSLPFRTILPCLQRSRSMELWSVLVASWGCFSDHLGVLKWISPETVNVFFGTVPFFWVGPPLRWSRAVSNWFQRLFFRINYQLPTVFVRVVLSSEVFCGIASCLLWTRTRHLKSNPNWSSNGTGQFQSHEKTLFACDDEPK